MQDGSQSAPSLLQQVRAHAKARDSIAWSGQARQLLLWAADTIEAANAALRSETAPSVAKDAARYRFLRTRVSHRDGETLSPAKCYYRRWHHDTTFKPDADTHAGMFDAAIDAGMQNAAPQGNKAGTPLVEAGKGSASSTDRTLPNEPAEPASPACASPNRHADLVADLQCAIAALNNSAPGMRREELALLCQRAADALSERLNTDKEKA